MSARRLPLERVIEFLFTVGVLGSGALLLAGLTLGRTGLLRAGILILMSTPVAGLVALTLGLLKARDWTFAAVAFWVLLVIASGMWLAARTQRPPERGAVVRSP